MTAKDLKNALLQEAVQGKLVPQIASEGNASDLLEEIRKERLSHGFANSYGICDGKDKKTKSSDLRSKSQIRVTKKELPEITEDEIPFEIPESWCWCRLGEIFQHNTGKTQNSSVETKNGTLRKFITTSNLYWNEFDFSKVKEMLFSDSELDRCTVTKGDLLVCEGGDYGRSAIWKYDYDVCFQNHIHRLRPFKKDTLNVEFYYYVLFLFKNIGVIQGKGVGIKSLSTETLHQILIPLPPLAEQKRIVAAIEKFMPLIEEYDEKETELKAFNEQIGALTKKAILQEAVQGKLVPQIASEGNARDLLEEIRKERLSHGFANSYGICDGKNKKTKKSDLRSKSQIRVTKKELPEITEDEIPFDIPENWCWCRLSEYIDIRDGTHDSPKFYDTGVPFVTSKNLDNGTLDFSSSKFISEEDHKKFSARSFVEDGDILFAMIGSIGNPVIVKKEFDFSFKNMALFKRYTKEKTDMKYIFYYLSYIQFELKRIATGGVQSFIGLGTFREMLFPLPPLAEQKRIVAAIEKMLPLCEKLGE